MFDLYMETQQVLPHLVSIDMVVKAMKGHPKPQKRDLNTGCNLVSGSGLQFF